MGERFLDPAPLLALFRGQPGRHVAETLGVTPSTVSKWRLGRARIRPSVADRAAVAAGLHLNLVWVELPRRERCGNGHDLADPYVYPSGQEACRECREDHRQAWRARKAAA